MPNGSKETYTYEKRCMHMKRDHYIKKEKWETASEVCQMGQKRPIKMKKDLCT